DLIPVGAPADDRSGSSREQQPPAQEPDSASGEVPPPPPTESETSPAERRSQAGAGKGSGINYEFVLRRYIASLTGAKENLRVLALYRREIDAHPNEAGLY